MPSPDVTRSEADAEEDRRLLRAARSGDDGAFAQLIERADPLLFELAAGMLDDDGIDEVLTESYVRSYRSVGRQDGDPRSWLLRTTYLTALAECRRRERRRQGGPGRLPDRQHEPESTPLDGIAPDERAVLILVDGAGLSSEDVAAALDVPTTTVRSLLDAARASLDTEAELPDSPVTSHGESFWPQLGGRLLAEREAPAVAVDTIVSPAPPAEVEAPVEPPSLQRASPVESGLVTQRRRSMVGRLLVRVMAVMVVIALVGAAVYAVVHLGSGAKSPVRVDSVADIARRTTDAMAVDQFSARFTRTALDKSGTEASASYLVVRDSSGSYLLTTIPGGRAVAFDAATGTRRSRIGGVAGSVGTGTTGTEETGLAAGPPDPSPGDADLPDVELDRTLRTLTTVGNEKAKSVTRKGTAAWQLDASLVEPSLGADRVEMIVDRDRLAPMSIRFLAGDRVVRSLTFEDVILDGPGVGPFTLDLSDLKVVPVDRGFEPVNVSDIGSKVGYQPVRPAYLPSGFELARTTARIEGGVVSLRYQRGFQTIVVTTRRSPVPKARTWDNPFPRGGLETPRSVAIEDGPFRGSRAERTGSLASPPALWGSNGDLAFTVSGDLTDDQLVQVAESLR